MTTLQPRTNIIVILGDDLGFGDIYQSSVSQGRISALNIRNDLPNIRAMAQNGVTCTSFYVSASICAPVRATLLTGRYQLRNGTPHNIFPGSCAPYSDNTYVKPYDPRGLSPWEVTLPELLSKAGYATGMVGKWHLGDRDYFHPMRHGFDSFYGPPYSNDMTPFYVMEGTGLAEGEQVLDQNSNAARFRQVQENLTSRYTQKAKEFISRAVAARQPFFLYMPLTFPHVPVYSPSGGQGDVLYRNAIRDIDAAIGSLRQHLSQLGVLDDTVIVLTSDNGPALNPRRPAHLSQIEPWRWVGGSVGPFNPNYGKHSVFEGAVRVPCIVSWPGSGGFAKGQTTDGQVAMFDLFPTLLNVAGASSLLPSDRKIDGVDASALFRLPQSSIPQLEERAIYFINPAGYVEAMRARIGNNIWKLHFHNNQLFDSVRALYRLNGDIGETENVRDSNPGVVQRMVQMAKEFRQDVCSPHPRANIQRWATNRSGVVATASSHMEGREPWRVLNGRLLGNDFSDDSRWTSSFDPADRDNPIYDDAWIAVDLGTPRPINQIVLRWEAAYARRYDIQISDDGTNWATIAEERECAGGTDFIFVNVIARHVRMQAKERVAVDANPDNPNIPRQKYGYSLYEFEVNYLEPGPPAPFSNLALNRPVRASSIRNGATGRPIHSPSFVTDGVVRMDWDEKTSQVWVSKTYGTRWASNWNDNEWIMVDLGADRTFNEVVLHWETAFGRRYVIEYASSAQPNNWKRFYEEFRGDGGTDYIQGSPVTGRYVRMRGLERGTAWGYSLGAFEVYHNAASGVNLALNKPVTVSSEQAPVGKTESRRGTMAIDGNRSTRWTSQFKNNPPDINDRQSNQEWLEVDLGTVRTIRSAVLRWEIAFGQSYKLQVRNTPSELWRTVHYKVAHDGVYNQLRGHGGVDYITFAPTPARYVRMQGIQRGTHWGYSLWEFEVYG